jgi:hypothetical protein
VPMTFVSISKFIHELAPWAWCQVFWLMFVIKDIGKSLRNPWPTVREQEDKGHCRD